MFSRGRASVSMKEISSKISDATLAYHYLGVKNIPCVIHSPLRQDKKPSFGLYSPDGKKVKFKDFATGDKGGIYDLLCLLWHCSLNDALQKIHKELIYNTKEANVQTHVPSEAVLSKSKNVKLEVKIRNWEQKDIDYWESYGVTLKWLKWAEVYPISHKIITSDNVTYVFGADDLAYAFVEHKEGNVTLKIYQPYNKKGYKWSNKHDRSVISLWTKIPEYGNKVVICSSLKDALCLSANTNIPALAIQGEGYGISNTAVNELKRRYNIIYILLDNDKAGLEDGIKLSNQTGFINKVLPNIDNCKDISDLYKKVGKDTFLSIILPLLDEPYDKNKMDDCPF